MYINIQLVIVDVNNWYNKDKINSWFLHKYLGIIRYQLAIKSKHKYKLMFQSYFRLDEGLT